MATSTDAQLILQLYDLRREPLMRKAREFVTGKFWPTKAEELQKLFESFGSEENAYIRQVVSYWEMATAMVNHGTIDSSLFADCNGEVIFIYAKLEPFVAHMRETMSPTFIVQIEQYIQSSPTAKSWLERMRPRIAEWTKQMKEAQKGKNAAAD